jgi:endonuclease III
MTAIIPGSRRVTIRRVAHPSLHFSSGVRVGQATAKAISSQLQVALRCGQDQGLVADCSMATAPHIRSAQMARALPAPLRSPAETRRIMATLAGQHPNANTELHFRTPYELLVATILSAQTTDERVNQVTPALFERYPDARALARATTAELEPQIQSTGFFRAKSRAILGMAQTLVERHGGEVPKTLAELVELPGVGRKTANVVLGHALGVPGLPVDRHVLRVSNRIGIARSEDPEVVEQQLCAAMPREKWTLTSDTLILHGRRICKPRPLCDRCAVREDCEYYRTALGAVGRAAGGASTPARRTRTAAHGAGGGAPRETPLQADSRRNHPSAEGARTGRGGGAPRQIKK